MFASGVVRITKALIWVHERCTRVYVFHKHWRDPVALSVEVCHPLWGCNLALVRQAFIESSVVKLDYGKVSTTDLSSFDIPLWYTELQEMI